MPERGTHICKSADEKEKGGCEKLKKPHVAGAERERAGDGRRGVGFGGGWREGPPQEESCLHSKGKQKKVF